MKVTFSCEKCGFVEGVYTTRPEDGDALDLSDFGTFLEDARLACPRCAQPTYGPLTVEMVAEALMEARIETSHVTPIPYEDYEALARFVIRLLRGCAEASDPDTACITALRFLDLRDWLLKLAREK